MLTKTALRELLLEMHKDAAPTFGDYDSYGHAIEGGYSELLAKLGLSKKWEIALDTDENGYVSNLEVRPRTEATTIPDVADWGEDELGPVNIDECVEFWWQFAKQGNP